MDLWSLTDLCTPWCVYVAVTLRVADQIDAGKSRIEELAPAVSADARSLARLLRHLVGKGIFEEPSPGNFALNNSARLLMTPEAKLAFNLEGIGGRMAHAWNTLLPAVRTGKPGYERVFGRPYWDDLE